MKAKKDFILLILGVTINKYYFIINVVILLRFIKPVMAYFISTFIMLSINYFLQKYYTFRSKNVIAIQK